MWPSLKKSFPPLRASFVRTGRERERERGRESERVRERAREREGGRERESVRERTPLGGCVCLKKVRVCVSHLGWDQARERERESLC